MRIREFIQENTAQDITKGLAGIQQGFAEAPFKRSGILALQGRYQEAEHLIRTSFRKTDPNNLQKVLDFIHTVKPIPNATSSKLDANPQVTDWLNNKYLPWVMQYIK
jgi:hypothetical protein